MVDNHRLVMLGNHTQPNANQCPTLLAKHRHLSVVSLLSRDIDSISAALYYQTTPVDTISAPYLNSTFLNHIHQVDYLNVP